MDLDELQDQWSSGLREKQLGTLCFLISQERVCASVVMFIRCIYIYSSMNPRSRFNILSSTQGLIGSTPIRTHVCPIITVKCVGIGTSKKKKKNFHLF